MPRVKKDFGRLTQGEIAEVHGISARAIRQWDEDGHPRNEDGTYSAPDSIAWRFQRDSGGALDLAAERARLASAQADKTEIENEVRAAGLLKVETVIRDVGDMLGAFRARILAIPDAIGQRFEASAAPAIIVELRRGLHEALAELAEYRPAVPDDSGESGGATPYLNGQSMGGFEPPAVEGK